MIVNLSSKRHSNEYFKSFTHKMGAKTSWHRYGTKLRHCHPMCKQFNTLLQLLVL